VHGQLAEERRDFGFDAAIDANAGRSPPPASLIIAAVCVIVSAPAGEGRPFTLPPVHTRSRPPAERAPPRPGAACAPCDERRVRPMDATSGTSSLVRGLPCRLNPSFSNGPPQASHRTRHVTSLNLTTGPTSVPMPRRDRTLTGRNRRVHQGGPGPGRLAQPLHVNHRTTAALAPPSFSAIHSCVQWEQLGPSLADILRVPIYRRGAVGAFPAED
jgi:hypothetical protein